VIALDRDDARGVGLNLLSNNIEARLPGRAHGGCRSRAVDLMLGSTSPPTAAQHPARP
jgi:hypothetical protein